MHDTITRLLTEALATALKDALVPIVREAVNEALATMPPKALADEDDTQSNTPVKARLDAIEERLDSIDSDMSDKVDTCDIDDKVSEAVTDCLDNGNWDITFRG